IAAGIALGLMIAFQFMTAAYYGLILGLTVGVAAVALVWRRRHSDSLRRVLWALAAAGVTALVVAGPVAARYVAVRRETGARHVYPAPYALRLGDLHAIYPPSRFLAG